MHLICDSVKGVCMLSNSDASSCSQYSITKNILRTVMAEIKHLNNNDYLRKFDSMLLFKYF